VVARLLVAAAVAAQLEHLLHVGVAEAEGDGLACGSILV